MTRLTCFLALAIAGTTWGCGSGSKDSSSTSTGGSATGGDAAGGSSSAGLGGGGSASVGAASSVTETCEVKEAKLAYDDAEPQSYKIGAWPTDFSTGMGMTTRLYGVFGLGQYELVFEPTLELTSHVLPSVISDAQPWPIRSALFADAREQTLGPIRCVAPGSGSTLARKDDQFLVDLQHVDVIETCADHPVDGQINLCLSFSDCDDVDGGSVDGTPWTVGIKSWAGAGGNWKIELRDGTYVRARTTAAKDGPAYWALIVTSATSAYGGRVYCASGGTIEETPPGSFGHTVMHWDSLGAVACETGEGTGTAQGCLKGE